MPLKRDEDLTAERYRKRLEQKQGECITLPFGRELWEYRTLIEKKKTRKLTRILNAMARFTKGKCSFPYPTRIEEFIKECDDIKHNMDRLREGKYCYSSDSSYGRDESVLSEGYIICNKIYNGSPGIKIYLCEKSIFAKSSKDAKIVVKVINLKKTFDNYVTTNLKTELDIILQVKHPFIIDIYCVLFRKKQYYIFMRFAERHDLFSHLVNNGPVTESEARVWIAQLASALSYLHSLDIAHNDLCCENILITEHFNLKLTDFESAVRIKYDMGKPLPAMDFKGAIEYASPEMLQGKPYSAIGGDTWALSVVLYAMLTAHLPFRGQSPEQLLKSQRNWKMKDPQFYSSDLMALLYKLFQFRSRYRYNMERFINAEWFSKDERLTEDGQVSPESRPKGGECRPVNDPGRERLVEDPAQELTDGAEVVRFQPFLREKHSQTTLIPVVYKDEDLGATISDDQSYGIPYTPGEEQAKHLTTLQKLWNVYKIKPKEAKNTLKKKNDFAKFLHKTYKMTMKDEENEKLLTSVSFNKI